jgi:hypothetical protein
VPTQVSIVDNNRDEWQSTYDKLMGSKGQRMPENVLTQMRTEAIHAQWHTSEIQFWNTIEILTSKPLSTTVALGRSTVHSASTSALCSFVTLIGSIHSLKITTFQTGSLILWEGPVAGPCEHGNEPSGSVKSGEFLAWVTVSFSRRIFLRGVS